MRFAVILLRRYGMRLKPRELAPSVEGELDLTTHADLRAFKRPAHAANLWADAGGGTRRSLLMPLWEPAIVHIGPTSLTLIGIELDTVRGRLHEHTQLWRCTALPPA
jgi:hypothetical protein